MYDLTPVRLSKRSEYVRFTDDMVEKLSAIRRLDRIGMPLIVGYGTEETPEFQRQARDFAAALKTSGKPHELVVGAGYNHFEIAETIANPYGLIGRRVLRMMGLGPD
jgi:arylformamidase